MWLALHLASPQALFKTAGDELLGQYLAVEEGFFLWPLGR